MLRVIGVLLLLISCSVFAGKERGNGGDVIACRGGAGNSIDYEVLDLYEARITRPELVFSALRGDTLSEKVNNVLLKLKPINFSLYSSYKKILDSFFENTLFIDADLVDVPDSYHLFIPQGCQVVQAAVNREPQFQTDKIFYINGSIWNGLDLNNKVALVLHEVIYYQAANRRGHVNSLATRYFVSWMLSNNFEQEPVSEVRDFLYNNNFLKATIYNDVYFSDILSIHPNGLASTAYIQKNRVSTLNFKDVELELSANKLYEFYSSGQVKNAFLSGNTNVITSGVNYKFNFNNRDEIRFKENGDISVIENKSYIRSVKINGVTYKTSGKMKFARGCDCIKEIELFSNSSVYRFAYRGGDLRVHNKIIFDYDGNIVGGELLEDTYLIYNGDKVLVQAGSIVEFKNSELLLVGGVGFKYPQKINFQGNKLNVWKFKLDNNSLRPLSMVLAQDATIRIRNRFYQAKKNTEVRIDQVTGEVLSLFLLKPVSINILNSFVEVREFLEFFPNGTISKVRLNNVSSFDIQNKQVEFGPQTFLDFHQNQKIKRISYEHLNQEFNIKLQLGSNEVTFSTLNLCFRDDGTVAMGKVGIGDFFYDTTDTTNYVGSGSYLVFNTSSQFVNK